MSGLDITLFSVGVAIFMVTVYGVTLAGGFALQKRQRETLADDVELVVNKEGYEVITSAPSKRTDHSAEHPGAKPPL
ncbi:MAG: hypothetical protein HKN41_02240 [Ilumatobacter sp.]|nr:hypothetical protein [Ilumatobacter sp.]